MDKMNPLSLWYVVTKDSYVGFESHSAAMAQQAKNANDYIGSVLTNCNEIDLVSRIESLRANLVVEEATA